MSRLLRVIALLTATTLHLIHAFDLPTAGSHTHTQSHTEPPRPSSTDDSVRLPWQQVFAIAEDAHSRGDIGRALRLFQAICDGVPWEASPLVRLALQLRSVGEYEKSVRMSLKAMQVSQAANASADARLAAHVNALSSLIAMFTPLDMSEAVLRTAAPIARWHALVGTMWDTAAGLHVFWDADGDARRLRLQRNVAMLTEHLFRHASWVRDTPPAGLPALLIPLGSHTRAPPLTINSSEIVDSLGINLPGFSEALQTLVILQRMFELVYAGAPPTCVTAIVSTRQALLAVGKERLAIKGPPEQEFFIQHDMYANSKQRHADAVRAPEPPVTHQPEQGFVPETRFPRVRAAYVSSDFRLHSVGFAALGVLGSHDTQRVDRWCYALGGLDAPVGANAAIGWSCADGGCELSRVILRRPVPSGIDELMGDPEWTQTERIAAACRSQFVAFSIRANYSTDEAAEVPLGNELEMARHMQQVAAPHIAIDLNGRSAGSRPQFWLEPVARIKVAYLGAPVTAGEPIAAHFIVTDRSVQPPELWHVPADPHPACACGMCHAVRNQSDIALWPRFSEAAVMMPFTYHAVTVSSHAWLGAANTLPAREERLHRAAACARPLVVGALHSGNKLSPRLTESWVNILQRGPACTELWLLQPRGNPDLHVRLQAEFAARGLPPNRIRFVGKRDGRNHRLETAALYASIDLFLDADIYGVHSMAFDLLAAGVPILTLTTEEWPGRVGAAVIDLLCRPESGVQAWNDASRLCAHLITHDFHEYETQAAQLLHQPGMLLELSRSIIEANAASARRRNMPFYLDYDARARELETAMRAMVNVDGLGTWGQAPYRAAASAFGASEQNRNYFHIVVGTDAER